MNNTAIESHKIIFKKVIQVIILDVLFFSVTPLWFVVINFLLQVVHDIKLHICEVCCTKHELITRHNNTSNGKHETLFA